MTHADARPLRILLAEDNPINQKVANLLLSRSGHEVTVAGNGREAMDLHSSGAFDVILMDVQMPLMSGLDATRAIREQELSTGAHIPIIAVTAHAMSSDRDRCLDAGMDDVITKPFQGSDLAAVLGRWSAGIPGSQFVSMAETTISRS